MKYKNGKELSYLELIKRLNIMGIEYNPDIIGKNYYINLYNDAIKSQKNKEKIKKDIEKDQVYINFYNEKLRKRKECSFSIDNENYIFEKNALINNNQYFIDDNNYNTKKSFFSDYNGALANKIILAHLCFTTYDHAKNNIIFEIIVNKLKIPIRAIQKLSFVNIYTQINKKIIEIINKIDILMIDKFSFIVFFSFIIIIVVLIKFIIQRNKK